MQVWIDWAPAWPGLPGLTNGSREARAGEDHGKSRGSSSPACTRVPFPHRALQALPPGSGNAPQRMSLARMNGDAPEGVCVGPLSWAHVKHFTYVVLSLTRPTARKLVWSLFLLYMWTGPELK